MQKLKILVPALFALAGYVAQPYLMQVSWAWALVGDILSTISLFTLGYLFNNDK